MRHRWLALALHVAAPAVAVQEATVVSEPGSDRVLAITGEWGELAGIGDLRSKPFGGDDISFAEGFALGTAHEQTARSLMPPRLAAAFDAMRVHFGMAPGETA